MLEEELTQQIIGACIEVHKHLGPGLLESCYEQCLCHELTLRGLKVARQRYVARGAVAGRLRNGSSRSQQEQEDQDPDH